MHYLGVERACAYRVDAQNRLEDVTGDWMSFATENGAPQLTARAVIGQPLLRFVAGKETRHLYEVIIDRVRQKLLTVVFPFRCDGPGVRRFMKLVVSPCPGGKVQFTSRIVREEEREAVPLFDASVDRSDEYVVVCGWCKRIEVSDRWLEVEDAVCSLQLCSGTRHPQLTHGLCRDCERRFAEGDHEVA